MRVLLGYGRSPLAIDVSAETRVLTAPGLPPLRESMRAVLAAALAAPQGRPRLASRIGRGSRVTIIVSDVTRDEPRAALTEAVLEEIGVGVRLTLAVATGTHEPGALVALELPDALLGRAERVVNHDATAPDFVDVGRTRRGTRVRYPRWLLESDLIVATGLARPHYFAGFGAGAKAVFPGLGAREDIRQNHLLKSDPTSRLGRVDENVCRDDLEEAAQMVGPETFLLNLAGDRAFAGDLVTAHRAAVAHARPFFEVASSPADVIIASDRMPITGSLYQASKLLPPAGMLLRPGGTIVLAAECPFGTGPLDVVNRGIYEIGVRKVLPEPHVIYLVSSLPRAVVAETYCNYAPSVDAVLAQLPGRDLLVLPSAGQVVPRVVP